MKLSVIIVNYNVKFYVEQCLVALQRAIEGIDADVYVVDNHSRDGSVDFLTKRFRDVNIISCNHNLGFARANNIAIRQSESEYVLLLNPDTIVGEQVIKTALDFMDSHPNAGATGLRMLKANGENAMESRRGLPTPMTSFYKMCGLCARYPKSRRFGRYYMSYLSWDEPVNIDIVSGAFCLLRREAINDVGLLDEDFFMYGEDIDLSYRLLKGGYENWYLPLRILHYKGESTLKSSFRYVHVFYEAMLIFFRKHYSHLSLLLSIPIKTAIYLKASVALVQMQVKKMRKSLGFFSRHRKKEPLYIFIGQTKATDQCRQIARKKGLDALFIEGDQRHLPDGHLTNPLPEASSIYVVYDVNAYNFDTILEIFSRNPQPNVHIGTYNSKTRTVITAEDILK